MAKDLEHKDRTVIDRYSKKKKFDWDTLWGSIFLLVILTVVLSSCAG